MKKKHNKKRNTAFLYETLVRELTKSLIHKDTEKRNLVVSIVKEHFNRGGILFEELDLYKALADTVDTTPGIAEKLLNEVKEAHRSLDKKKLFHTQTKLIKKINKELGNDVWNNFVPNFKSLATISSIFNPLTPLKQRVLYEETVLKTMSAAKTDIENMKSVDNLVYKSFVKKYNQEYDSLLEGQKTLLSKYISSFADNGVELKIYLNEEIGRLKDQVGGAIKMEEVYTDEEMLEKAKRVINLLEEFRTKAPDKDLVLSVLKIQKLATEIVSDD